MQQYCNNCGAPITAGMTACARCGAPVSSGSGGYDPTVRAGTPPGTGYGSQPYGPPPTDPYGAPPPPPPPAPGFGAPPPPPGFGAPLQPGFGAPQQPFMAPPPPKKSRTWLYVVIGIVVVVLLACAGAAYAISRAVNTGIQAAQTVIATFTPPTGFTPTSGNHITNVQIGKGDDQGNITTQTSTFTQSDTIVIKFTVTTQDSGAHATIVIRDSTGTELQSNFTPLALETGTHDYYFAFSITGADSYTAELQYNGTTEQTVPFTVA